MIRFFRKYHKWIGLFFSVFIILFAFSGIVLNHRRAVSKIDISRNVLPASYQFHNWNNGAVKGMVSLSKDSILLYGTAGIWLTDSLYAHFSDFSQGIKEGADNHQILKIVKTYSGELYAVTNYELYHLEATHQWKDISSGAGMDERLTDISSNGDSLIVLSRSHIFLTDGNGKDFKRIQLQQPFDYTPRVTLFRTLWLLHSGELFGLPGQLFVDFLGIVIILLCITGWLYFFLPKWIKHRKAKQSTSTHAKKIFKWSVKWHNKPGAWLFVFLLILSLSGMFLRPPLLIAIIRANVSPVPGSILDNDNVWHDKLRCIRLDAFRNEWLLYSSSGFYALPDFESTPLKVVNVPPVSVMGVTVLEPEENGWLVGSFSGLYFWNRQTGEVIDCYTGQYVADTPPSGRPVFDHPVSGLIHRKDRAPVVFEYNQGAVAMDEADPFVEMPDAIRQCKMSLWNFCLEIHTGRAYLSFLGPLTDWFIFLSGLIISLLIISGYVVYRKRCAIKKS